MKLKISYEIEVDPKFDDTEFSSAIDPSWKYARIAGLTVYIPVHAEVMTVEFPNGTVITTEDNLIYVKHAGKWSVVAAHSSNEFSESCYGSPEENLRSLVTQDRAKILS